jgi:Testicular haploid expressed repeat
MVLCRYYNPRAECNEFAAAPEKPPKGYRACTVPVDCAIIAGCDHLKQQRARKFRCKSRRISQLALPKNFTEKYQREAPEMGKPKIEIIRTYEEETPARVKLLAYTKVRKLISSKEAYWNVIDSQRKQRYDVLINRSYHTMYSRLAKVGLPKKTKHSKWTQADWKRHCEWLKKRALPKMTPSPPKLKTQKVPLSDIIKSIQKLAKPKDRFQRDKYRPRCGYKSTVKNTALHYAPTEGILKLSLPKQRKESVEFNPFTINPNTLKYQITEGLLRLAVPKSYKAPEEDEDVTPFGVMKRALKATLKPDARTLKLSVPKEKPLDEDAEEKPLVNPRALKASIFSNWLNLDVPQLPSSVEVTFDKFTFSFSIFESRS